MITSRLALRLLWATNIVFAIHSGVHYLEWSLGAWPIDPTPVNLTISRILAASALLLIVASASALAGKAKRPMLIVIGAAAVPFALAAIHWNWWIMDWQRFGGRSGATNAALIVAWGAWLVANLFLPWLAARRVNSPPPPAPVRAGGGAGG